MGVESKCELLDFELDDFEVPCSEIKERLNKSLISGVTVLDVYENGRKIRDLSYLICVISLEFDNGIPAGAEEQIRALFDRENLMVPKKTKSGIQQQDIIPMIRKFHLRQAGEKTLEIEATICCQNPTLNPMQIPLAINVHCPDIKFDFSHCSRLEVLDKDEKIFR